MHLNALFSRFIKVLSITWRHSGVENNFKSVAITFHLNDRITLFDIYSQRSRTHIIYLAINWFLLQQVKDKSCVFAEVWFTQVFCLLSHGRLWMRRWRMDAGHEDWRHKGTWVSYASPHVCDMDINFQISVFRKLFITILTSGATETHTTWQEERLGLIHKRPSCQPTGTQPSPRSAWVWKSATNYGLLRSTSPLVRCTRWSLTANTAPPHLVVTRGRSWLVHRPPYRPTVTKKGSTLSAALNYIPRPGITSNEANDCVYCDSRIGFGTGGYPYGTNTCGNGAEHSPDNGDRHIKVMGYILVQ